MTTVWRTQFTLEDAGFQEVYGPTRAWAVGPRNVLDLPWEPTNGEWVNGKVGASARARVSPDFALSPYAEQADCGAWALLLTRSDTRSGLQWDVEVACEHLKPNGTLVTITVSRRAFEGRAPRLDDVSVVAPRICGVLLHRFTSPNIPRLPERVGPPAEVTALLNAIISEERSVPIIAVSEDNWARSPVVSVAGLATHLVGTAIVVHVTKEGSLTLRGSLEALGLSTAEASRWGVYNGAVRVYLPGCDFTSQSPFWHPLYLPASVDTPEFASTLESWAFDLSVLAPPRPYRGLSVLRIEQLRAQIDESADAKVALEWAKELEAKLQAETEARLQDAQRWQDYRLRLEHELEEFRRAAADAAEDAAYDGAGGAERPPAVAYFARGGKRPALDFVDTLGADDRQMALQQLSDLPRAAFEKSPKFSKLKAGKSGSNHSQLWEYRANTKGFWLRFFVARSSKANELLVLSGYAKKQNTLDDGEIDKAAKCLEEAKKNGWS